MSRPFRASLLLLAMLAVWGIWRFQESQAAYAAILSPAARSATIPRLVASDVSWTGPSYLAAFSPQPETDLRRADIRPARYAAPTPRHQTFASAASARFVPPPAGPPAQVEPLPRPPLPRESSVWQPAPAETRTQTAFALATAGYSALRRGERHVANDYFDRALAAAPAHENAPLWHAQRRDLKKRWAFRGYSFIRAGGSNVAGSRAPILGGGQSGIEAAFTLNPLSSAPIAAFARADIAQDWVSLDGNSAQAAIGLRWLPLGRGAPSLTVERLIGIGSNGRDAWAARAAWGGQTDIDAGLPLRLSAYGEVGIIGAKSRDLFAGGQAYALTPVVASDAFALSAGGGVWGGIQNTDAVDPARLDVGPSLWFNLQKPVPLEARLEYRYRVAGDAAPRDGASLTLAAEF